MKKSLFLILYFCVSHASVCCLHDFTDFGCEVSDLRVKDGRFEREEEKKIREIFDEFAEKFHLSPSCFDANKRRAFHNMTKKYGRDVAIKSFKFGEK